MNNALSEKTGNFAVSVFVAAICSYDGQNVHLLCHSLLNKFMLFRAPSQNLDNLDHKPIAGKQAKPANI